MILLLYVVFIFFLCVIGPWITFRIWGETNHLGLFIVFCRRYRLTRWLTWNIWGDDNWYYDNIEKRISEWKRIST